jgi:dCMP deaminase
MTKTAIVSYIPVLHKGYVDFFAKHKGDIFVLDSAFVRDFPRMERDIRALEPGQIAAAINALGLPFQARVLDKLSQISEYTEILLPNEDLNRQFADKHLEHSNVRFVDAFLRWDLPISTAEHIVPPDRTVTRAQVHHELMRQASTEAAKSPDWWRQVGALITKDGQPLLTGHNHPLKDTDYTFGAFGDPRSNFDAGQHLDLYRTIHAEAALVAEAARRGISLDRASIYVTTFPCPVCAKLLAVAGVEKVYYSKGYSRLDAEDILSQFEIEIILVEDSAS